MINLNDIRIRRDASPLLAFDVRELLRDERLHGHALLGRFTPLPPAPLLFPFTRGTYPAWFGSSGPSSTPAGFGFLSLCLCGFSSRFAFFIAFTLARRFEFLSSSFFLLRNKIMDDMNFKTSSRPSAFTLDVGIIDGERCHRSSSLASNSALFSSTLGIPGLSLSHFVKTIVNGTLFSISQSAYSASFACGGTDASMSNSTPARFERVTK